MTIYNTLQDFNIRRKNIRLLFFSIRLLIKKRLKRKKNKKELRS